MTSPHTTTRIVYGFEDVNAAHLRAERRYRRRFILAAAAGIALGLLIGSIVTKAMANVAHQIVEQDGFTTHEFR